MVTKTISIIDDSVLNVAPEAQVLSLRISDHCIETAILDSAHSTVTALECWEFTTDRDFAFAEFFFDKIFEESSFLKRRFEKIFFLPDHNLYTLIPDKLFQESNSSQYLKFNHTIDINEKLSVDRLMELQLRNIYWQPYEVTKFAEKYFPNVQYIHLISSLLTAFSGEKKLNSKILINYCGKRMDVIVFKESQFVFCNSFFYDSPADMIYFLLNIFQQTSMNTSTAITLTGELQKKSEEYEIISKYFSNVSFARPPTKYNYYQELLQLSLHKYYGILNSFKCAL